MHGVQVHILELASVLLECLLALCHPHSIISLAFYERSKVAGDLFWQLLPERFTAPKMPEESFGMEQQADNLGLFELRSMLCESLSRSANDQPDSHSCSCHDSTVQLLLERLAAEELPDDLYSMKPQADNLGLIDAGPEAVEAAKTTLHAEGHRERVYPSKACQMTFHR